MNTLEDLGISDEDARRWVAIGVMSADEYQRYVEAQKSAAFDGEQIGTWRSLPRRRGKSAKSKALIAAAKAYLAEAHPTTVRGVCYYLFTRGVIASMSKNETGKVSKQLTDAREAGAIPWEWVVDETRELEREPSWDDPDEYVRVVRRSYRRDFWTAQPARVEIWSEKGTIRGVLKSVLDEYGVGFRVMHGYGSATAVHEVAATDPGTPLIVLYVGDWDPSGMNMSEVDLPKRLSAYGGHHVTIRRIALTQDDLEPLPSFPASSKKGDSRYGWFVERYGDRCWELDAMHPNELRDRVESNIKALIEPTAWAQCERAQSAEQESLKTLLDRWKAAS
jgi:hypothetical protein